MNQVTADQRKRQAYDDSGKTDHVGNDAHLQVDEEPKIKMIETNATGDKIKFIVVLNGIASTRRAVPA